MHELAQELNSALGGTVIDALMSELGRNIFYPKGIVAQSAEAKAAGVRVNATQGIATDDDGPLVLPAVSRYFAGLSGADYAAYAPTTGVAELRRKWAQELYRKNPSLGAGAGGTGAGTISLPVVTCGLTAGFAVAAEMFVDPGDTVIVAKPFWGNYRLVLEQRRGGVIRNYPLFADADKGGGLNVAGFEKLARECTAPGGKLLCIFNFPNNPTGYTPSLAETDQLVQALVGIADTGTRVGVIVDDAYFGLQWDPGSLQESLFARIADAHENILGIKIDGATKEEFAWGFRVGFVTFGGRGLREEHYEAVNKKCAGLIRSSVSNCNHGAQEIILRALEDPQHGEQKRAFLVQLTKRYEAVREALEGLQANPALTVLPFNSGYFVTFRCHRCSAETVRVRLLKLGIGVIAIDDAHVRFTYSTVPTGEIPTVLETLYANAEKA